MQTYIEKLENQISSLFPLVDALCDNSTIHYRDLNSGNSGVVFLGFDYYVWAKKDLSGQLKLKEQYLKFCEDFNFLLAKTNKQLQKEIENAHTENIHTIEQTKAYTSHIAYYNNKTHHTTKQSPNNRHAEPTKNAA